MPLSNLSADLRISNSHDNVRSLAQATAPRGGLVPFAEAYIEGLSALQSGQYRVAIDVRRRTRITYRQANLKREHTSLKSDTPRKLLRRDLLQLTMSASARRVPANCSAHRFLQSRSTSIKSARLAIDLTRGKSGTSTASTAIPAR